MELKVERRMELKVGLWVVWTLMARFGVVNGSRDGDDIHGGKG